MHESETVTVQGHLYRKTFAGEPSYESIIEGDASEVCWIVKLEEPIQLQYTTIGDHSKTVKSDPQHHLQLQLTPRQYESYGKLINQDVFIRGKLYAGHTGHHHTTVLIEVEGIGRQADS